MNDHKTVIAKLRIIKNMAIEPSVKELVDVLIEYISSNDKGDLGFRARKKGEK